MRMVHIKINKIIEINQSLKSKNTDEENDLPNQIPITPIKEFLKFCGILTSVPNNANTATKKAGHKTHGKGNNKILNNTPPKIPIRRVLKIILVFFKSYSI